jgi:hypothetical protein
VRGIGVRSLKRMLPHLVVDAPPPEQPKEPARDKGEVGSDTGSKAKSS